MWTIHDFLAYGFVAGCVTKGYKGCGLDTIARYFKCIKKHYNKMCLNSFWVTLDFE
jgi:hypothetical protein